MFAFLGPLLGGLAGLLFPGAAAATGAAATGAAATGIGALLAKAAIPALGAGLGTLVTGGSGKDAIRNALLMGGATALFPGVASGIQNSAFGKNITGGLASIFGGGPEAAGQASAAPAPAPQPKPVAAPGEAPRRSDIFGPSGMEMEARGSNPPGFGPSGMEMEARGSNPPGFGPSGMEMEARGSNPPVTTLPSIREMTDMAGGQRLDRMNPDDFFSSLYAPPGPSVDLSPRRRAYRTPFDLDLIPPPPTGNMRPYAKGGEIAGPGTGTSDSIPATIYQDGKPVQKAALSDGEFVMTAKAVKGAGNGSRERGISRMYELMRRFERGEIA